MTSRERAPLAEDSAERRSKNRWYEECAKGNRGERLSPNLYPKTLGPCCLHSHDALDVTGGGRYYARYNQPIIYSRTLALVRREIQNHAHETINRGFVILES